jgi:uncharacterized protein YjbJ (UPF0337 family)
MDDEEQTMDHKEQTMHDKDPMMGRIKQALGDLTGNDQLKRHGKADIRAGKAKAMIDTTKTKIEHLVDSARGKLAGHRS